MDAQECVDTLIKKLSASSKESPETYSPGVLGGQPSAIGTGIRLNGRAFRVIGVTPDHFRGLIPGVTPFSYDPELRKIGRVLFTQKQGVDTTQMIIWAARKSI